MPTLTVISSCCGATCWVPACGATTNMQKDLAAHSILDIHKPRSLCREERERKIWCDRYLLDAAAQVGVLLALGVERADNDDAASSFHHLSDRERDKPTKAPCGPSYLGHHLRPIAACRSTLLRSMDRVRTRVRLGHTKALRRCRERNEV